MKIIQSFWSGRNDNFRDNRGWLSYEFHWLGWILSCNQLRQFYDEVELYTDTFGYEILIEKLKLPYTKIHVVLDEMNKYPKDLWAIAKVKTYELQNEPFLHIDGDVFIWDKFPDDLLQSELIAQNLENTTDYYREMWNKIAPKLKFISNEIKDYHNGLLNLGCNMGIIGGNNVTFFTEYPKKSFEFVDKNKESWEDFNLFNFNIFFEQQLFYEMASKKNLPINYLFEEIWGDNSYLGLANFNDVPHKRFYLHLLGDFKRRPNICKNLESFVINFYPEFFERLKILLPEKYDYLDDEIPEYDFSKSGNEKLIDNFKKSLTQNNLSFDAKNLLARDLFFINQTQKFDTFITNQQEFWLILLKCFAIENLETEEQSENQNLKVSENSTVYNFYDFDNIDLMIIEVLKKPIVKSNFFIEMYKFLDEGFSDEDLQDFNILLINRLRYFLECKILVVLSENDFKINQY